VWVALQGHLCGGDERRGHVLEPHGLPAQRLGLGLGLGLRAQRGLVAGGGDCCSEAALRPPVSDIRFQLRTSRSPECKSLMMSLLSTHSRTAPLVRSEKMRCSPKLLATSTCTHCRLEGRRRHRRQRGGDEPAASHTSERSSRRPRPAMHWRPAGSTSLRLRMRQLHAATQCPHARNAIGAWLTAHGRRSPVSSTPRPKSCSHSPAPCTTDAAGAQCPCSARSPATWACARGPPPRSARTCSRSVPGPRTVRFRAKTCPPSARRIGHG